MRKPELGGHAGVVVQRNRASLSRKAGQLPALDGVLDPRFDERVEAHDRPHDRYFVQLEYG